MATTTVIRFLIWTVDIGPCGTHSKKEEATAEFYEEPTWYYIHDDVLHCFGYAPGFMKALYHYVRRIPATLALRRWYRNDDRG